MHYDAQYRIPRDKSTILRWDTNADSVKEIEAPEFVQLGDMDEIIDAAIGEAEVVEGEGEEAIKEQFRPSDRASTPRSTNWYSDLGTA